MKLGASFGKAAWHPYALALGSTLATLLIAEIGLRHLAPVHLTGIQRAYQHDPELGYRLKSDIHLLETTDHQQEIRVNRLGTVNFQESFSGYALKVFALGDSYTQGTGLPADASYPFQLDLTLNLDPDGAYAKRFAVVNLGLAAFGGEQSLLTLRRFAGVLGRPDFVLYLGAENDAQDDAVFERDERHRHLVEGNPQYGPALPIMRWLAATELGKRSKLALASLRTAGGDTRRTTATGTSVAEQQKSVLERLSRQSRELDAELIVTWSHAPSPSYDWLKGWAKNAGVGFADWLPAAQSVRQAIPEVPWHNPHSGGHLRTWVNQVIARAYAAEVLASSRAARGR